jgi:hypothetical protein
MREFSHYKWRRLLGIRRRRRHVSPIDDFVVDDFVLTTGSVDVVLKMKFKAWASAFHGEDQCSSISSD